jgi:hypothetical protein
MNSIEKERVEDDGGKTDIWVGVCFEDDDSKEYEHSIVWRFEPTFATDSQTPVLEIRRVLHKKYWVGLDEKVTTPTTDDGSDIKVSKGWAEGPFDPSQLPESVFKKLRYIFGDELAQNTVIEAADILDVDFTSVNLIDIPNSHTVITPEFTIKANGRYTDSVDKSHERVIDGAFTRKIRDGETEEVLDVYHPIDHSVSWWFTPSDSGLVEIEKCVHKIWDEGMVGGFETKYENEEVIEACRTPEASPSVASLPDDILRSLAEMFGEPFVVELLEDTDAEIPTYVYECFECGEASEVTPRSSCPECGASSVCRYESPEEYRKSIEQETERDRKVKEKLAQLELTFESEEP